MLTKPKASVRVFGDTKFQSDTALSSSVRGRKQLVSGTLLHGLPDSKDRLSRFDKQPPKASLTSGSSGRKEGTLSRER